MEATEELLAWFRQALKRFAAEFDVRAIAVTAHGATCSLLGEDGTLAYPVVSYTSEKGAEIQDAFYEAFGPRENLHRETCTPDLGFANVSKALFYIKTRLPEVWARCRQALFYDSYLSYELTGRAGMEHTYLGNHTYLWDFHERTWSTVARDLGVDRMFPEGVAKTWECLGPVKPEIAAECGVSNDCLVTHGIHDSNANLVPYLAKGNKNFILNSTGTWCVCMRQSETPDLTDAEMAAKVFYNLDVFGNPLKTSIFPAGMEYDAFRGFTEAKDEGDREAAQRVIAGRSLFVVPGVLPDACPFPQAQTGVVHGERVHSLAELEADERKPMTGLGQDYFAALDFSLALATRQALTRCGAGEGTTVFVEGGFSNNRSYCELLAALCPQCTVALTNMKEGTSFGAAITAWMAAEDAELEAVGERFAIETTPVPARDFGDIDAYTAAFEKLVTA